MNNYHGYHSVFKRHVEAIRFLSLDLDEIIYIEPIELPSTINPFLMGQHDLYWRGAMQPVAPAFIPYVIMQNP